MSRACDWCQRVGKTSPYEVDGKTDQLCKDCAKQAVLKVLLKEPVYPDVAIAGSVTSVKGGVADVRVGVKELDEWTLTDSKGKFNLRGVLSRWLALAVEELFTLLYAQDPVMPESWLRQACTDGHLPQAYDQLLRSSDIGVSLDRSAFLSLAAGPGVLEKLAPRVFASGRRKQILVLSFVKSGLPPTNQNVDVLQQLASPSLCGEFSISVPLVEASAVVDPSSGGTVPDEGSGATVTLLPGTSLVGEDGAPYAGAVTVSLAVIDPSDPKSLEAMPGDFSGVAVDGSPAQIESFGAMWVGIAAEGGAPLQLAEDSPGMELSLLSDTPINFERLQVPPTIWEYSTSTGKWVQNSVGALAVDGVPLPPAGVDPFSEDISAPIRRTNPKVKAKGKMKKSYDNYEEDCKVWTPEEYAKLLGASGRKKKFSLANVKRAGYWNIDAPYRTAIITGRLVDEEGLAVTRANAHTRGIDYSGFSPVTAVDLDGMFTVVAQCKSEISIHTVMPRSAPDEDPPRHHFTSFKTGLPGGTVEVGDLTLKASARWSTPPPSDVGG
mmetsp:Transcript_53514/g.120612  ORF Transcript_53514/g.120612 Transcript_53514/m.120612 type:complete len:550 (+) Transcript_53514:66-1715(+)